MDVDVIELVVRPCKKKVACLIVRYLELHLKCDLVYFPKHDKAWVRMPEVWVTPQKKQRYCYWPTAEISDEFQKVILNKIFDKYSLDLGKIRSLHEQGVQKRGSSEKPRQDLNK